MSRAVAIVLLAGILVLVAMSALRGGREEVRAASADEPDVMVTYPKLAVAPELLGQSKDLIDLDGWLQTDATALDEVEAEVKIVQFWTFGCFNCKNTLPHLANIYEKYQADGLEIIGVHSPEFDFEAEVDAIAQAAIDLKVTWPIALDTNKVNFRRWQAGRRFWPRTFVLDANNEIRFDHIGEGNYDELEATIAYLLEHGVE